MKRLGVVVLVLMLVVGSLTAAAQAEKVQPVREIVFASQSFSYCMAGANAFKEYVEKNTNGALKVTVIDWKALGNDREVTDQLRLGEIEVFNATTGSLSGIIPEVGMTNLPFLFPNRYVGWEVFNDAQYFSYVQDYWLQKSNNTIRFLGASENSIRHLYTTRGPIKVPSDLTSYAIKMRTPAIPMYTELFSELGSTQIVTLGASERYSALQSGLMDGTEGGLASAWQAGLLEVCDYVTLSGHMFDHHYYIFNNEFYESLSPEFQKIIDEAGNLAAWVQNVGVRKAEAESLQLMIDAGKVIHEPSPDENAQWREIGVRVGTRILSNQVPADYMNATFAAVERVTANLDMKAVDAKSVQVSQYL